MEILVACGGGNDGIRCLPGCGEADGEAVKVNEGLGEAGGGWLGVGGFLEEFEEVESRFSAEDVFGSKFEFRTEDGTVLEVEIDRSEPAVASGDSEMVHVV